MKLRQLNFSDPDIVRLQVLEAQLNTMRFLGSLEGFNTAVFAYAKQMDMFSAFVFVNAEYASAFGYKCYSNYAAWFSTLTEETALKTTPAEPAKPKPRKRTPSYPTHFNLVQQCLALLQRWHCAGYTTQDRFINAMCAVYPEYAGVHERMPLVEFYFIIHITPTLLQKAETALLTLKPGA
jgi:hypothetical protein